MSSVPEAIRRSYARTVAARAGTDDPRLIEAFATVERERFLGPGPWQVKAGNGYLTTTTTDPAVVYQDILIALAPEKNINNGEPSLHAKSLGAAAPRAGDVALHAGAGTGYYTAILAHLVGPHGTVHAYEIEPALAAKAAVNLRIYPNVVVHATSAIDDALPLANVIYVSAGVTHVPRQWLDALAGGGRLVVPITPNSGLGFMLLVTKHSSDRYAAEAFSTAAFIPCVGARDSEESRALEDALSRHDIGEIRSLKRGGAPDQTVWSAGKGWWLSTAPAE
ncbi:MAG TPA: hypothetical protein VJP86_08770 [Vicinamibacterales bacterium]|jgi:protein-L-isoaspartate(D-aspartate) O-methyltransferase|nr:hypothetical protein [Vicinamibacterales bacterium]